MSVIFPDSPEINDSFEQNDILYVWDGDKWISLYGTSNYVGASGATGPKGAPGNPGPDNSDGATGATGPTGVTGSSGIVGPASSQGVTGDKGLDGIKGPTGVVGPAASQGVTGNKGVTGEQGVIGNQGPASSQGVTGVKGVTGNQGPIGDPAPAANVGATGDKGPTGPQGATGDKGPIGNPSTVKGATGDTGPQGASGPTGLTGTTGSTGFVGSPGVANTLNSIGNVNAPSPANDQVLKYDSFSNNYVNSSVSVPNAAIVPTLTATETLMGTNFTLLIDEFPTNSSQISFNPNSSGRVVLNFFSTTTFEDGDYIEISRPASGLAPIKYYFGRDRDAFPNDVFEVPNSIDYNVAQIARLSSTLNGLTIRRFNVVETSVSSTGLQADYFTATQGGTVTTGVINESPNATTFLPSDSSFSSLELNTTATNSVRIIGNLDTSSLTLNYSFNENTAPNNFPYPNGVAYAYRGFTTLRVSRTDLSGSLLPYASVVSAGQSYGLYINFSSGSSFTYRPYIGTVTVQENRADLNMVAFNLSVNFPNVSTVYPCLIRLFPTQADAQFWAAGDTADFNMVIDNSGNLSSTPA